MRLKCRLLVADETYMPSSALGLHKSVSDERERGTYCAIVHLHEWLTVDIRFGAANEVEDAHACQT